MTMKSEEQKLTEAFNIPQHARFSLMGISATWTLSAGVAVTANQIFESNMLYIPGRSRILSMELTAPFTKSAGISVQVQYEERSNPGTWTDLDAAFSVKVAETVLRNTRSGASDKLWTFQDKDWNLRLKVAAVATTENIGGTMRLLVIYANT